VEAFHVLSGSVPSGNRVLRLLKAWDGVDDWMGFGLFKGSNYLGCATNYSGWRMAYHGKVAGEFVCDDQNDSDSYMNVFESGDGISLVIDADACPNGKVSLKWGPGTIPTYTPLDCMIGNGYGYTYGQAWQSFTSAGHLSINVRYEGLRYYTFPSGWLLVPGSYSNCADDDPGLDFKVVEPNGHHWDIKIVPET